MGEWWCSSAARMSDRHAADAGSIPWCDTGFFSQSQLSVQTLDTLRTFPCAIACINICAHVKDPVVQVRVWWILETPKHPVCTVGWVARLCYSWFSSGKSNPNFPRDNETIYFSKKSDSLFMSHVTFFEKN